MIALHRAIWVVSSHCSIWYYYYYICDVVCLLLPQFISCYYLRYTFSCKLKVHFSSSEVCKLGRRYNFYIIPLLCLSFARPYLFILSHSYVHGVMHVCAAIVSSLLMFILDPLHLLHESSILFMFHFLLHYLHFLLSTRGFHCNSRGEYLSNIFPRSFTSPGYSWPSPMS